jgi:hypothetical protein
MLQANKGRRGATTVVGGVFDDVVSAVGSAVGVGGGVGLGAIVGDGARVGVGAVADVGGVWPLAQAVTARTVINDKIGISIFLKDIRIDPYQISDWTLAIYDVPPYSLVLRLSSP